MRFTTLVSTLTALASAGLASAAAPRNLKVVGYSVLGTGCPVDSAEVRTDPSNTWLEVRLSEYVVRSGPGVSASDWRKNCKITLNLQYDSGFSFATLATDLRGYAVIPRDTKGQCQTTADFTGDSRQVSYGVTLPGGFEGAFGLSANPDVVNWSQCGGSTAILNINTSCWISETNSRGLIAVDRISNRLTVRVALHWRNC